MINVAALALLVSSLAAAGVWSPPPDSPRLIREGHRLIVVEYERHIPSDQAPDPPPQTSHGVIGEAKERFQESSSLLPNAGQGIATPESASGEKPAAHSAKDLICDAYGSCKEKISHAFHMGKERIKESAADVVERAKEKASDVKESAEDAVERAKEKASDIKDSAESTVERAKEEASDIKDSAESTVERAKQKAFDIKESVKEKVSEFEEGAKDAARGKLEGAKDAVRSKMDSTKDAVKSTVESAKDAVKMAADVTRDAEHDLSGNISQAVGRAEEAANLLHQNLTDIMNRARGVAVDATKYVGAPATARAAASIAHLMAFALVYGTCVWVTFVSSHVLAAALPRQQFGMVQSKLYPVYFRVMAYGVGIACLGRFFARERVVGIERVQGYNLLAALGLVLVNMFYLEPEATKVMFERMKMEKEEGRGRDMADVLQDDTPVVTASTVRTTTATAQSASTIGVTKTTVAMDQEAVKGRAAKLNKRLRKLNGNSSFVNILTLMSLTWHLVHLGRRLQMSCTSM